MLSRYFGGTGLGSAALLFMLQGASAQTAHVMELNPAASAVMDGRSSQFFVRFDRPVDHANSLLVVTLGGKVVETLHPSLDAAPNLLFARAPRLSAGNYMLHWSVKTISGAKVTEGDIPFTVRS